ncbi:MAG: metallophosphoesterase [Chlamydiota bacterium]
MSSSSSVLTRVRSNTVPQSGTIDFRAMREEEALDGRILDRCRIRNSIFCSMSPSFKGPTCHCFYPEVKKEVLKGELESFVADRQRKYPEYNPKRDLGYFIHKSLPIGSHIVIRADLHGNLFAMDAFSEQIRHMRYYSWLNGENSLKQRILTVLLGDVVDRGPSSWYTLRYAMQLPGAEILRGNHENVSLNRHLIHSGYPFPFMRGDASYFYTDSACQTVDTGFLSSVQRFYSYLPLGLSVSCSEGDGPRESIMCTHGTFEVDLDMVQPWNHICLDREKSMEFSLRIQRILSNVPVSFRDPSVEWDVVLDYLENRFYFEEDIKMIGSALKLDHFLHYQRDPATGRTMQEILFEKRRNQGVLSVVEGRKLGKMRLFLPVKESVNYPSEVMGAYYRVMSDRNSRLSYHFRGHDHWEEKCEDCPVWTLPAAPEGCLVLPRGELAVGADDVFLDITVTSNVVKLWDCQRMVRTRGSDIYRNGGKFSLQ